MKRGFEKKLNEAIDLTDKICNRLNCIENCYYSLDGICEMANEIRNQIVPEKKVYISILDQLKEIDSVENLGECMDIINRKIEKLKNTLKILS